MKKIIEHLKKNGLDSNGVVISYSFVKGSYKLNKDYPWFFGTITDIKSFPVREILAEKSKVVDLIYEKIINVKAFID
ncbi:TPA: hypothetical protein P0E36_004278 [Vibrio harveyi]|nr:hypothetical protein [Vibrio harveyi]